MKKREPVKGIMSSQVITANLTHSLSDAETMMKKNHIRHIPVVNGSHLVGILSLTDLLRISFVDSYTGEGAVDSAVYSMLTIDQVMKNKPITIQQDVSIKDAAQLFSENEFHALPVMDGDDLVGIVTTTDIIKYLIDQY